MRYKLLGTSGYRISEIGFGCMSLSGTDTENEKLLRDAVELGINFFDTADMYDKGRNEATIGRALASYREKVIIATKVGNQWRSDGSGWDWNPGKQYILRSAEESLKRLQVSHIDLYQLHGGTIEDPIDETIEAFEQLKKEGKIRHYGISSIRPNVIREYVKRSSIVSVMMQYSLIDRRPEEECLDLLFDNNIGVLVRGSLAQGLLVHKPARDYLEYTAEQVAAASKVIREVAGSTCNPSQTAIGYVLTHPAVTTAVLGIRNRKQLEEAVYAVDQPMLDDQEYQALKNALPAFTYRQHR